MKTKVSVIVTTRHEEANIERCLRSISEQTYPNIEIIVVDNNSQDRTKEIAKEWTDKVFNKGPERSAQRNYGVEVSEGEYVLYLDADMAISPDVVSECVKASEGNANIKALYVPEVIVGSGYWIAVRNFERSFYDGTVVDAVRFIKKDAFQEIKGFDTNLCGPEDWDLDKRIRKIGSVDVIKSPLYHDEGSFDLDFYLGKKSYYATTFDKYVAKWGANDNDVKRQLGFFYRYFTVFLENNKFWKLLRHPILALGMYYLRFRVGIEFLKKKLSPSKT